MLGFYSITQKTVIKSKFLNYFYYFLRVIFSCSLLYLIIENEDLFEFQFLESHSKLTLHGSLNYDITAQYTENYYDSIDLSLGIQGDNHVFIPTSLNYQQNQNKLKFEGLFNQKKEIVYCKSEKFCSENCSDNPFNLFELMRKPKKCSGVFCEVQAWCPLMYNKKEYKTFGKDEMKIVAEVFFYNEFSMKSDEDKRQKRKIQFSLEELTKLSGLEKEDIKGVMLIKFDLDCYWLWGCKEKIQYIRLDNSTNINDKIDVLVGNYFKENLKENIEEKDREKFNIYRDLYEMKGIHIFIQENVRYGKISFINLLMEIGSALTYTAMIEKIMNTVIYFIYGGYRYEKMVYFGRSQNREEKKIIIRKIIEKKISK